MHKNYYLQVATSLALSSFQHLQVMKILCK